MTAAKLRKGAVTTEKIRNGVVTRAKLNLAKLGSVPAADRAALAASAVDADPPRARAWLPTPSPRRGPPTPRRSPASAPPSSPRARS